jgi:hypothetical protein
MTFGDNRLPLKHNLELHSRNCRLIILWQGRTVARKVCTKYGQCQLHTLGVVRTDTSSDKTPLGLSGGGGRERSHCLDLVLEAFRFSDRGNNTVHEELLHCSRKLGNRITKLLDKGDRGPL